MNKAFKFLFKHKYLIFFTLSLLVCIAYLLSRHALKGNIITDNKLTITQKSIPNNVKVFPYAIESLSKRNYPSGVINIEEKVSSGIYLISYKSDGLKIFGTMAIPKVQKPKNGFPVIILNHGYINPKIYNNLTDYTQIQMELTNRGYIVIKPDYRGNGRSDGANEPLNRFAYPIDVINLITSLNSIKDANPTRVYIWGHSMGGEISLKVIEISSKISDINGKIKAAVLWAPVTDPVKWFNKSHLSQLPESVISPFPYSQTFKEMGTPDSNSPIWKSVSPISYLKNINVPIQLDHGTNDQTVPYSWSEELTNDLKKLGKTIEFISYQENDHNLSQSHTTAVNNTLNFYSRY
jgi:uncharacterized protein